MALGGGGLGSYAFPYSPLEEARFGSPMQPTGQGYLVWWEKWKPSEDPREVAPPLVGGAAKQEGPRRRT